MRLVENDQYTTLFERLARIRCVIDLVPLSLEGADGMNSFVHRQAAMQTLNVLKSRSDAYVERLLASPKFANRRRDEFFTFSIDADALGNGEPISVDEFLGPHCDPSGRRLLFNGKSIHHVYDLFWFGDAETPENRIQIDNDALVRGSFSRAYLDPPYMLGGTLAEQNAAFFDILDILFGSMNGEYSIYRWCDESSNYFDAGKEWWGTYFWTVHQRETDHIFGIAASATD